MSKINNENKKQKRKKREFSLEKIASGIHCENLISSIRNKYVDPLIIRHKSLLPKIKSKRTIKVSQPNEPFSPNKILFHEFENKRHFTEVEEEKAIQTKNNISKEILPKIASRNESFKNMNNKYFDSLIITGGIFNENNYYQKYLQNVKLSNLINIKSKNPLEYQNIYPKIYNINKLNEKYNLKLDLTHINNKNNTLNTKNKRMSKKGLMNYLFKKYVIGFSTVNNNTDNMSNTIKSKKKNRTRKNSQLSIISRNSQNDISNSESNTIDILKKDSFNEDTNTFLTKLNIEKIEKKETSHIDDKKIKNSKKNIFFERNKNIINYDKKITVDCLKSNVESKILQKKLLYKYIDKTTFELQKEPLYKKVKKFEALIDKIIKNHN